jgi:signal transduction histidine kinase/ActR/RegA family two-component response regulator
MSSYLSRIPEQYHYAIKIGILFLLYVITARLGLSFYTVHGFATLVWPPSGIALAVLILFGRGLWPGVALGAFVVNLLIGASPVVAAGIALGNTLEAFVGAYVLKEYMGFEPTFGRLYDSAAFVIYGAVLAPMLSATIGTLSLTFGGVLTLSEQPLTWFAWWIGDMLGVLVLGPLLLVWLTPQHREWPPERVIEAAAAGILLIITDILIFWSPFPWLSHFSYLYLIFIPIGWIALRFGVRGKTLAIFMTAALSITAVASGYLIVGNLPVQSNLIYLQIFIATTGAMFLVFGSIVEERRRITQELRIQVHKSEETLSKLRFEDEAKKEFLALLAHELRNPLAPVVSGLEIIREQPDISVATKSLLSSMRGQVRTMVRLIDDLLDISRISQKKLELQKELIELHTLIKRCVKSVEPLFKKNDQTFDLSLPEEELWFEADPVRLEQILVNLLNNAAKYTPPGGHISCSAIVEGGVLRIHIKDSGIGIAPSMLERIFEPFLQLEQARKQGTGLGVGLTLSRYLTEMHGGTIEAHSEGQGRGSEFVVTLPLTIHAPPSRKKLRASEEKHANVKGRTVLVVDDNVAAAKNLSKLLTMRGYETRLAFSGGEALSVYEEFRPKMIVLDVGLPDMTGYEVARSLRSSIEASGRPQPVIIALTGFGQEEDKERAYEAGFDHHLTKPVGIADLEALLKADD